MPKQPRRAECAKRIATLRQRWPLDDADTRARNGLRLLRAIAAHHKGHFDGDRYLGSRARHPFTCARGHSFAVVAGHLLAGSWCAECDHEGRRLGIAAARKVAKRQGGTCLSMAYLSQRDTLRWRCTEGHEWEASLGDVRDKEDWCPVCRDIARQGFNRNALDRLVQAAKKHGGTVVSTAYIDTRTKVRVRCREGHEWDTFPDSILKKGTWCPRCRMNWHTPDEQLALLRQVVRREGGTLLSKTYVNRTTKVTVRCDKGHVWDVQPAKLRQGRWCPTCHYDRLRTYTTQKTQSKAKGRSRARLPIAA